MLDARPFALAEDPLLRSATDRVAAQLQVEPPKLCLIDDGFPRAFVVGRGPGRRHARRLDRPAPGRPPRRARGGHRPRARPRAQPRRAHADVRRAARDDARSRRAGSAGFSRARCCSCSAPIAAAFTHALLSPKREYAADRDAATRLRPARPRRRAPPPRSRRASSSRSPRSPATEPLYTVDPFERDRLSRMFRTHPPLAERVRRLRALDAADGARPEPRRPSRLPSSPGDGRSAPKRRRGHTRGVPLLRS